MLVFIDESGDTGMKLGSGSSSAQFIVSLVLFEELEMAEKADRRIETLRSQLGVAPGFEFHFSKLKADWREQFLRELGRIDFFYFAVVIDKASLAEKGFHSPAELYRYACRLVFECAKPYLTEATVVMDGAGSRPFKRELTSFLRRKVNEGEGARKIRKIKLQDSHKNNLLQLADMVCGAVARSFSGKPDAALYRKCISHREMEIQKWPRE